MSCWREVTGGRGKGAGLFGCYTINAFVTVRAGDNWERGNGIWEIDCGLRKLYLYDTRAKGSGNSEQAWKGRGLEGVRWQR